MARPMNPSPPEETILSTRSTIIFQTIAPISSHCPQGSLCCAVTPVAPMLSRMKNNSFSLSTYQSFLLSSPILPVQGGLFTLWRQSDSKDFPCSLFPFFLHIPFLWQRLYMIPLPRNDSKDKERQGILYFYSHGLPYSPFTIQFCEAVLTYRLHPLTTNILTYRT